MPANPSHVAKTAKIPLIYAAFNMLIDGILLSGRYCACFDNDIPESVGVAKSYIDMIIGGHSMEYRLPFGKGLYDAVT